MVAKLILVAVLFGGASAQEPRAAFLNHEELKQLLSGTTTARFARSGTKGIIVLTQDGKARLDGGSWAATGAWRIDGPKYCSKYPGIRRGYETCYTVQRTGQNAYLLTDTDGDVGTWVIEK